MVRVALLLAVVTAVFFGVRWYNRLPPAGRKRAQHGIWLGAAGLGILGLVATGRLHWLAALFAPLVWGLKGMFRLLPKLPALHRLWQQLQGMDRTGDASQRGAYDSERMTAQRARSILEVGDDAGNDEIIAAHRRLMRKMHPDTGGSTYLASQINQARDVLLGRG